MKIKNSSSKRYLFIGLFAIICAVAVSGNLYLLNKSKARISDPQSATYEYNWYFNPRNDGKQPEPIKEASFFSKYNSYYVGDPNEKVIYLTFDAGYENGNTSAILDALKKHQVPATFFVVGNFLSQNPDLIKRMEKEGHIIGNHTMTHPNMSKISTKEAFQKELSDVEAIYKEVTGKEMIKFYRPPQGIYSTLNLSMAKELGYHTFFWSLAYVDWYQDNQPDPQEAITKLTNRIHPGAIVLLHSTSSTNALILDELLSKWEQMGYSFHSLKELIA